MEAETEILGPEAFRDRDLGGGGRNFKDGDLGDGDFGGRELRDGGRDRDLEPSALETEILEPEALETEILEPEALETETLEVEAETLKMETLETEMEI